VAQPLQGQLIGWCQYYDWRNENDLIVDEKLTVNLPRRHQLAVCSRCLKPQPQRLRCRLLTVGLAVSRGGWCW